ncbi:MAG: DMT family transporter [Burkholderiaceae bacterium]
MNALGLHSLWAIGFAFALSTVLVSLWRLSAWPALLRRPRLLWMTVAAGITNAAFNWGVMIGEVVRVVLFYLMPVWSLLARWLLREPITGAALARIGLAIGGAAIVLWQPGAGTLPASLADWLGIVGASFALVNVLVRRHRDDPDEARAGDVRRRLRRRHRDGRIARAWGTIDGPPGCRRGRDHRQSSRWPPRCWPATSRCSMARRDCRPRSRRSSCCPKCRSPPCRRWDGGRDAARTIVGGLLILGATLLASLQAGAAPEPAHAHPSGDPR